MAQNATKVSGGLFPLSLTPFELLMVAEDRVDYPMVSSSILEFEGMADRAALNNALDFALDRNPLLCARVETRKFRRPRWVLADERPSVEWRCDGAEHDRPVDRRPGITLRPGLRIEAFQSASHCQLILHSHHVHCDGVGIFQFIEDLLVAYSNAFAAPERAMEQRAIEPESLRLRSGLPQSFPTLKQRLRQRLADAGLAYRILFQRPAELAVTGAAAAMDRRQIDETASGASFGRVSSDIDTPLLAGLRRHAARCKATLNDVMMADLFLAAHAWNKPFGGGVKQRFLRMNVPCNLRTREHSASPAANIASYAFVSADSKQCEDPDVLLDDVRRQTACIRNDMTSAHSFVRNLGICAAIPFGRWLLWGHDTCYATSSLTSMGDPTRLFSATFPKIDGRLVAGNLTLDRIAAWPPVRPRTHMAMVTMEYQKRLVIAASFDRQTMSAEEAQLFLDQYVRQLGKTSSSGAQEI